MESTSKPIETSTMELELMVEDELARLQRQYRIMESDRIAYLDHITNNVGKQNDIIRNLTKEHNSLILDLQIANSKENKRRDNIVIFQLKQLMDEHSFLVDKIKIRKTYVTEIDHQIRKVQKQIVTLRVNLRKVDSMRDDCILVDQQNIIKLENKLETSNNRYGTIISKNKGLRLEIDHLLKERQLFNKNWQFLFSGLEGNKKFMLDLIEQATLAYDQREEWCRKLEALKYRGLNDLQCHSEEMRELQRTLVHDVGLQNFLNVKGQRRIAGNLLKKELLKREQNEIRLKEQTEKYSNTLRNIQEFAGSENVNQLASKFIKQEEENFALFNYIHELNSELETLADSIGVLHIKIDEQRQLQMKRSTQQTENLEELRYILHDCRSTANEAQERCISLNKSLRNVFVGIGRLFQKVNYNTAPILGLLGQVVTPEARSTSAVAWKSGESDMEVARVVIGNGKGNNVMDVHNVQLYLGVLENAIGELVKMVFYTRNRKKRHFVDQDVRKCIEKPNVEAINSPCPLCYELAMTSGGDIVTVVMRMKQIQRLLHRLTKENPKKLLHKMSNCELPGTVHLLRKRDKSKHS